MNDRIRDIERQSGIELYGLGKDRSKWQQRLEKFSELLIKETMKVVANNLPSNTYLDVADAVIEHFGDEDRTVPVLSGEVKALLAGIEDSEAFTVEGAIKAFGVEEVEDCPRCGSPWGGTSCGIPDCGWATGVEE